MGNVLSKISTVCIGVCCCGICRRWQNEREAKMIYDRIRMEAEMFEKTELI